MNLCDIPLNVEVEIRSLSDIQDIWVFIEKTDDTHGIVRYAGIEPTNEYEDLLENKDKYTFVFNPTTSNISTYTKDELLTITDDDLERVLEKSSKYPYHNYQEFISSMSHYIKSYGGEVEWLKEFATELYMYAYKRYGKLNFCYFIALIEYLCEKNNQGIPECVQKYIDLQMTDLIFEEGTICIYEDGDEEEIRENLIYTREYIQGAIESFLRHNLVITTEVFDIC